MMLSAALPRSSDRRRPEEFAAFTDGLGWERVSIGGGGTARTAVGGVRTASDEPAEHTIEPHQDMAHNPAHPSKIAFFMVEGPPRGKGGETILVDMRARRYFTRDRAAVDAALDALPGDDVTWSWSPDGTLDYENTLPATRPHPATGEPVWFNGIHTNHRDYFDLAPHIDTTHGSPYDTTYGDGDAIDDATLAEIRADIWNSCVAVALETGDVVVVDNFLAGHGRIGWDPAVRRKMLLQHFA
ncbi:platelet-activating factor acetyltransferase [Aureococcus anophagefferens]|nr:platelet-activating factor acetyltransferase [Aureococcus anophagefferens]